MFPQYFVNPKINTMKKYIIAGLLLFVLLYSRNGNAQSNTITVSGRITSFEESLPLEGVTVRTKTGGTSTGTLPDGSFSLPVSKQEKLLLVSLQGYEQKEVLLTGAREYEIVLKRKDAIARRPAGNVLTGSKK